MAAIDKIYVNSYDEYIRFRDWLNAQPKLHDKYGKEVSLMEYFFDYWDKESWFDKNGENVTHPVYSAPYYVDAYIIRNCPIEGVQKDLMINYGYWSQERIREFYENVKNYDPDKDGAPYWAKLEDFIFNEDGTMSIKGLEKSSYEEILDGELYVSPYRTDVEYGTHFRLIKSPNGKKTIPFEKPLKGMWWVTVENTNDKYDSMWYSDDTDTWDFTDEFVVSKWTSNTAYVKTITALKRKIRKWKLPIGTKVCVSGRYVGEEYEFVVTK